MACHKLPYGRKHDAKAAARRASATHGGRKLEAYHCAECDAYHVGHPKRRGSEPCRRGCGTMLTFEPFGDTLLPIDPTGVPHDWRVCPKAA